MIRKDKSYYYNLFVKFDNLRNKGKLLNRELNQLSLVDRSIVCHFVFNRNLIFKITQ